MKVVETNFDTLSVEILEIALDMAKKGQIRDVVLVASIKDGDGPGYYRAAEFQDRWRILGALEYAKDCIHQA